MTLTRLWAQTRPRISATRRTDGRELLKRVIAGVAMLALPLALLRSGSTQTGTTFSYFPTASTTDSRMLSLGGAPLRTLAGETITIDIGVPAGNSSFQIGIFDGDTGKNSADVIAPAQGLWDQGTSQLIYTLFADPQGNGTGTIQVAQWTGNDPNPTAGTGWTADSATMPDNNWWNATVQTSADARNSVTGNFSYKLLVRLSDPGSATSSNFKLRSTGAIDIPANQEIGIQATLAQPFTDGKVIYPEWDGHTIPGPGSTFWQTTPTTYDGSFNLFVNVPSGASNFSMFDGDTDFGSGVLVASPSGVAIAQTDDTNDPDSTGIPSFATGTAAVAETAESAGQPEEDNHFDFFRRSPAVQYRVLDAAGNSYRNTNPAGNQEWEQFRITTSQSATRNDADFAPNVQSDPGSSVVTGTTLPAGTYRIEFAGLDLQNLTFLHFPYPVLGVDEGGNPVTLPTTAACGVVSGKGAIVVSNNEKTKRAQFKISAFHKPNGVIGGSVKFTDRVHHVTIKSKRLTALTVTGSHATITGVATINGRGNHAFTVDVDDNGTPGAGADTFRIEVARGSSPYIADTTTIATGDITIEVTM